MQDVPQPERAKQVVTKFKDGALSQTAAFLALHSIFSELPPPGSDGVVPVPPTEDQVASFMDPFVDMCDQWTRDKEATVRRGKKRIREGDANADNADPLGDGDGNDSDELDEPTPKRKQPFEEDELPWVKSAVTAIPLREDLAETVRLLGIYGVDPKRSLRSLLARTRVEFPESQWVRLLTNNQSSPN
jgi:hypothetical protein